MAEQDREQNAKQHQHARRDAETQMALGLFLSVISVFVLIGTFWADTTRAIVVNLVFGLILLAIGAGMALWGLKSRKKLTS